MNASLSHVTACGNAPRETNALLGRLIANGSVPGVFYATAGTNQTLRYVSPFAQSFILNWIAVEP